MRRAVLLGLTALLLMGGRRVSAIHAVNSTDAEKLIRDVGVFLLDVQPAEDFKGGHIPGATSIPVKELAQRLRELPADKTQPILVYCRSGERSSRAAQLLHQSGRKDIYHLTGGLRSWVTAQRPVKISPK